MSNPNDSFFFIGSSDSDIITTNSNGENVYYGIYKVDPRTIAKQIPRPKSPMLPLHQRFQHSHSSSNIRKSCSFENDEKNFYTDSSCLDLQNLSIQSSKLINN